MADPLPWPVVCGASSPVNDLSPAFPISISRWLLYDRTHDTLDALDNVPPLHLHALFGCCFALCRCGASAGTRCALDTRHLGMHRWEKPSTPSNALGDEVLICNGICCIEQRRAC